MTAADLEAYVNLPGADGEHSAFVTQCWEEAVELVECYVGSADVPATVLKRACLEVGSELFHRRQAPNGIAQFATLDGSSAVRVARDPMVGAYPILKRFIGGGFA